MSLELGIEGAVYLNTNITDGVPDNASPTWEEIDQISDFTPNETWDVSEIMIRRSRVKYGAKTTVDISFAGKLLKERGNAVYDVLFDAIRSPDGVVDLLILSGKNTVVGACGIRADFQLTSATGSQNPGDTQFIDFAGKPYPTANAPQYAEVIAGPTIDYTDI